MIAQEKKEKIVKSAAQAPSGDNAQPWRFEFKGDVLNIYNIPGKDYSPYNFKERGSLFAIGAAIENSAITASSLGYHADVKLFPSNDQTQVARISFNELAGAGDDLVDQIPLRMTNRKPYKKMPLAPGALKKIIEIAPEAIRFLEDPIKIAEFASTVSLSDRLIFEDKDIHEAIFNSIRWSEEEEAKKRGLYIKTLELPPPARFMFGILKDWPAVQVLNHIKISKFIATQSASVYRTASAIGMVIISDDHDESFVNAGRIFERIWLTATQAGIRLQPVTALAYLAQRVDAREAGSLSKEHADLIRAADQKIKELFGNPAGIPAMLFRIGYGDDPSAHSQKAAPAVTYTD